MKPGCYRVIRRCIALSRRSIRGMLRAEKSMKIGCTLGKYAPLHKGHEFLISTALNEMDHVIVIIYNASEVTDIPTSIRASWIKVRFPTVEVMIAEEGPQETGYTQEIIDKQNNYLINLLKERQIDSFYSSEKYGQYVSNALNCKNRIVDLERKEYPISSTMIRNSVLSTKKYVSKCVFDCIKPKLYFLGGPSTGKSTISSYSADVLGEAYCKEYGRDYWFQHQENHRLTMNDLEIIAYEQTKLEEEVSHENKNIVFIDTTTITTLAYAYYYFGKASDKLENQVKSNLYKYKNIFLCDVDIPFDNTWDRSGPGSREELQEINKAILQTYNIAYILLSGSVEERFDMVRSYMEVMQSCGNF